VRALRILVAALIPLVLPSAVLSQQAAAGGGRTVQLVVFPLSGLALGNAVQQAEIADAFRSMIITELSGMNVQLVERERLERMLEAQSLSLTGAVSDDAAIRIGQLLGAQYAVSGSIVTAGEDARLDLRLFDIETGLTVHTFKDRSRPDRLLSLANRVATEFAGKARLQARVEEIRVPAAASLAFSQGLDYERRGRRQDAARMYQKALELFPQHPHARAALQRVN
jgi:TolB-like protein